MKKTVILLFALAMISLSGCGIWWHERMHDESGREYYIDVNEHRQYYDEGDKRDKKDEHKDARDQDKRKDGHRDNESDGQDHHDNGDK
jgi:uncharacterized protein YxeA